MQHSPKTGVYEKTPKTVSSVRNLKITDAADALRELKSEYDTVKEAISSERNPESLVFITTKGTPMHTQTRHTRGLSGFSSRTDLSTADKYLDFISEKEDVVSDTMAGIFG